jgi:hypothetical protein
MPHQTNFQDYPVLRMGDAPKITITGDLPFKTELLRPNRYCSTLMLALRMMLP